jgi:hypothetical protein
MSGELISTLGGKVPQRAIRHIDSLPYVVSYDIVEDFAILGVDFDGSDVATIIATPASRRAKWIECQIFEVTEAFVGHTTDANVSVGDGADIDEFGVTDDIVDGSASQIFTSYDGSISSWDTEIIQPGDQVTITCVAATGGNAAGIARVSVSFMYFE